MLVKIANRLEASPSLPLSLFLSPSSSLLFRRRLLNVSSAAISLSLSLSHQRHEAARDRRAPDFFSVAFSSRLINPANGDYGKRDTMDDSDTEKGERGSQLERDNH